MHEKRTNRLLAILFFLYLAWLLRITVFRPGFSLAGLGQNGVISPTPFLEYYNWLRAGVYGTACYLFFGNIGVFLPFGAYLAWRWPSLRLWQTALAGFGLSLAIEAGQYLFGTGGLRPGRPDSEHPGRPSGGCAAAVGQGALAAARHFLTKFHLFLSNFNNS